MAECRFKFPFAMEDDFRDLNAYARTRTPIFGTFFYELAVAFMTDRNIKKILILLTNRRTGNVVYMVF